MAFYYNPRCRCGRCRTSGMMGPSIMITLGVLFLLQQTHWAWQWGFHRTWPILLIVIGVVKILKYTAPTDGHIPVGYFGEDPVRYAPPAPPAAPQPGNAPDASREDGHV